VSSFFLIFFLCTQPVSAQQILFQDNFDDHDISDWRVARNIQWWKPSRPCWNRGADTTWEVKDGKLGIKIDGPACSTELIPNLFSLEQTPAFEFEFDMTFTGKTEADRNGLFIWKDDANWYGLKFLNSAVFVQKVYGDFEQFFQNNAGTYPFEANQTYHISIIVRADHHLLVKINNQLVLDVIDEGPYLAGFRTIGVQASVGQIPQSEVYFDNVVVKELPAGTQLGVPIFKQTDLKWLHEEYDQATKWSDAPTIGRWGCAMTSMAMIMRHYGMNTLPSGDELNPSTLNAWLKNQPDGYVGSGALNWQAVTRLSRQISEKFGTPKLEYRRRESSLELAKQEIQSTRPVVLEVPGHFLVGDGINPEGDVSIKDPAYSYTKFAQHKKELVSVRTLQPSFTDLSYLVFATTPSIKIQLLDANHQPISAVEQFPESISDPSQNSTRTSPSTAITQLAKPQSGTYYLQVIPPRSGSFTVQGFAYALDGEPASLSLQGFANTQGSEFQITFDPHGQTTIAPVLTWDQLKQDLQTLRDSKQFTSLTTHTQLTRFTTLGPAAPIETQIRYVDQMMAIVKERRNDFSPTGREFFEKQLTAFRQHLAQPL
jgi:hypothetical protein